MRFLAAKLAFIHRTLWRRDPAYRWAVLLGPPPLFGCALATLALAIWQHVPYAAPAPGANAPWAHWNRPLRHEDQPYTEPMTAALPQKDAAGRFPGFEPGWLGNIRPMSVDATMDVDVIASTIASLTLEGPTIPLSRILDAGPPSGTVSFPFRPSWDCGDFTFPLVPGIVPTFASARCRCSVTMCAYRMVMAMVLWPRMACKAGMSLVDWMNVEAKLIVSW